MELQEGCLISGIPMSLPVSCAGVLESTTGVTGMVGMYVSMYVCMHVCTHALELQNAKRPATWTTWLTVFGLGS